MVSFSSHRTLAWLSKPSICLFIYLAVMAVCAMFYVQMPMDFVQTTITYEASFKEQVKKCEEMITEDLESQRLRRFSAIPV
jgi:hypothetical protein